MIEKVGSRLMNRKIFLFNKNNFFLEVALLPWSRFEKSMNDVLEPLGVDIKTVAVLTQRLTHVRKTVVGVRKKSQDDQ